VYVDDKVIIPSDADLQIIEDHPLAAIEGTDGTVLALGACWHGKRSYRELRYFPISLSARAAAMAQHFHGHLSGLSIEQKEDSESSTACIRDCQEYLEMPDVPKESGIVR
jgi:hypothetical protein